MTRTGIADYRLDDADGEYDAMRKATAIYYQDPEKYTQEHKATQRSIGYGKGNTRIRQGRVEVAIEHW